MHRMHHKCLFKPSIVSMSVVTGTCVIIIVMCTKQTSFVSMQAQEWANIQHIGSGANGSVWRDTSTLYPSGVLKRGDQENLWSEADFMHKISHPNMGQVYCKMTGSEVDPDGRQIGYLVMKPLGRSLRALLAQRGNRG